MQTSRIWEILTQFRINSITGMPLGDVRGFYLDLVLSAENELVEITGTAYDLPDRTEAFVLTVVEGPHEDHWKAAGGQPGWSREDVLARLGEESSHDIWRGPRRVRYYLDPDDRDRGLHAQGPLKSAAAIELSGFRQDSEFSVVLYATPEYPCAVEVTASANRRRTILSPLEEFVPGDAGTMSSGTR